MKKYIIPILFTCGLSMGTLTSCEDYLETPLNGGVASENFFQNDDHAEMSVTVAYDMLIWHHNQWGWGSPILSKILPSDEGQCGGGGAGDQPGYQTLDDYAFDASNDKVLATWGVNYFGIYRANLAINNIDPESDFRKRLIAEAKALRAYYYMELVSLWGDVPLVLEELIVSEYNQARTPAAEVYQQIEKDLTEAIADLPLKSEYSSADQFRISKGTAQTLLGKAYLFQEKYSEAASTFASVISSGEYQLEMDYATVFSTEGEFGVESILEGSYSNSQAYNWGNFPWGQRAQSNIHTQLMGPRAGAVVDLDMLDGWGFLLPSPKLYDAYEAEGDVVRRSAVIITAQEFIDSDLQAQRDAGVAEDELVTPDFSEFHDFEGFFRAKFGTYLDETSTNGETALNYGSNWRLLRFSDVLLMAAEAYHKSGNDAQALVELNKVRERVSLTPLMGVTGNDLFEAIVKERFLELAFEGQRYVDLKRWGLAERELGDLGYQAKHALWPIPQSELVAATNLTQNPNW
ncbi:RagB/SusD family nutrient uptake outer membrane protein [Sediminitomix flava]|uniref:Putative outer membrane starch-binding protein n=1 Tax=Sediminitomix flava TaxID=379075 RepID=A0A315ZH55_SEDFL|nr:RagB/SusD family nutrient uptake outer membrane protein [Sediminitomix flava]PWJ44178.1 putative outer membrane starch-binding protein [Sediminitomix flava]